MPDRLFWVLGRELGDSSLPAQQGAQRRAQVPGAHAPEYQAGPGRGQLRKTGEELELYVVEDAGIVEEVDETALVGGDDEGP